MIGWCCRATGSVGRSARPRTASDLLSVAERPASEDLSEGTRGRAQVCRRDKHRGDVTYRSEVTQVIWQGHMEVHLI